MLADRSSDLSQSVSNMSLAMGTFPNANICGVEVERDKPLATAWPPIQLGSYQKFRSNVRLGSRLCENDPQ